jgi:putative ABC transport system permease protein
MLLNYLKIFLRLFSRNRTFTFINLLGLATGMACFVLIRLYVINETSYDRHYPDADHIYRMAMKGNMSGFSFESAVMGGPLGRMVRESIPEVEHSTTFYKLPRPVLLKRNENRFYEENILYVDSAFLEFFSLEILLGNPEEMFEAPYSMVLTRSGASKYFGDDNAIGQVINWNNQQDYTVTGVIADPVYNSHLKIDILASLNSLLEQPVYRNLLTTLYAFVTYNYIKMVPGTILAQVDSKIADIIDQQMGEGMRESGSHFEIFLQPVRDIHLNSKLVHELENNGNKSSIYIFSAVSLLILVIACINFVNLTTARSTARSMEIWIRRACGGSRMSLFIQFISESVFFAMVSIVLAAIFIELILPWFYNFSGINPVMSIHSRIVFYGLLIVLSVITGFLSGIYPAAYLSRIRPVWIIKGLRRKSTNRSHMRNALVIVQLAITLFLIFNTILIYKQLQLIKKIDIGINKDQLLVVPMRSSRMTGQLETLKNVMNSIPGVSGVTATSGYLGNFQQRRGFYVEGFGRNDLWMLHHISVDPEYLEIMETRLVEGRYFRQGSLADSLAIVINTAMMKQAEWEDPIGKKVIMQDRGVEKEFNVIGMVDDFNYASVHTPVQSLIIFNNPANSRYLCIRTQGADQDKTLEAIGSKWNELYPDFPFDYFFQEESYDDLYKEDRKMGNLFIYFTMLTILISVMGLFGLILFTSVRRTREIGIRKAMGAEVVTIVLLLIRDYPLWILIASLLALPASWYFAAEWLENFARKTSIDFWIYIISVILVMLISLGTTIYQTIRAARANPADSLRYE